MRNNLIGLTSLLFLLCVPTAGRSAAVSVKIDRMPQGDAQGEGENVAEWSLTVSTILQGAQRVNVLVTNAADTTKERGATKPQSEMLTVAAGSPQHMRVVTWGARPAVRASIVKTKTADTQKPQEPAPNGGTASGGGAPAPKPPAAPAPKPPGQKPPAQKPTPAQKPPRQ